MKPSAKCPLGDILSGCSHPFFTGLENTMNGSIPLSSGSKSFVIENGQRFSASVLWQLQRSYYQNRGIEAWNQGAVPHYITNNPVIAGAYARVVVGFLRDCLRKPSAPDPDALVIDPEQPVYILEPGAGTGRFAYHFLKRLLPMLEQPDLRGLRVVYILSDMVESNMEFWRQHPKLQPFVQAGQLDFAHFDALSDEQVQLEVSGITLSPGSLRNPLIALANYFLCAIPMDIFSVDQGILREELVMTICSNPLISHADPAVLPYLSIRLSPRFAPVNYYPYEEDNQLLQEYARLLNRAYISFPRSARACLRNFARLSGGRMLLIAGDRGYYRLDTLRAQYEPRLSLHGNSVSMPVNFHAVGDFFLRRGGQAVFTQQRDEGLVIAACTLGSFAPDSVDTHLAFQEAVENDGPDDFFQLKKAVEGGYTEFTLDQLLAFLRISGYDANIFFACAGSLLQQAELATDSQQDRLYDVLCRVWDMYYPIGEPQNVPEMLAKVFISICRYREALSCLHWSISLYGENETIRQLVETCQRCSWDPGDTFP